MIKVQLVDENDNPCGLIEKIEAHKGVHKAKEDAEKLKRTKNR